jgi:putative oxidoreductase
MLLMILFSYTVFAKLIDIKLFAIEMHNQPLPWWFTSLLVYLLPAIEILIAIGLFFENHRFAALVLSLVLMLLFTAYTTLILIHMFPRVPCSCGGVIKNLTWKQHLVFNLFFNGIIIWALILNEDVRKHKRIHA